MAAVNCDDDSNKRLCGTMGVQGFPTLKIVKPSKKKGKPYLEDYHGPRSAKAITDTVVEKIPNLVKRLTDKNWKTWVDEDDGRKKAILFTDKSTISTLFKVTAIDFQDDVAFAQIRDKEIEVVDNFKVVLFPTLILLSGEEKEPIIFDGEPKKDSIAKFLRANIASQPSHAVRKNKIGDGGRASEAENMSLFSEASASHLSSEASETAASATNLSVDEGFKAAESPNPNIVSESTPPQVDLNEEANLLPILDTENALREACFDDQKRLCVLVLLTTSMENESMNLSGSKSPFRELASIKSKYHERQIKLFPIYGISSTNPAALHLRETLGIDDESKVHIVAVNSKRSWWREYGGMATDRESIEAWIDAIRMGDGTKKTLPANLFETKETIDLSIDKEPNEASVEMTENETAENKPDHDEL